MSFDEYLQYRQEGDYDPERLVQKKGGISQLVKPGAGRPGYGGGARGWNAQMKADEIAEGMGYASFYDMPRNLQDKVYDQALMEIDEGLASIADMRRKNEAQGGRIGYDIGGISGLRPQTEEPSNYLRKLEVEMAKKKALLEIAQDQNMSEENFEQTLNEYMDEHGSGMGFTRMANDLGYWNNWEGDRDPNELDATLEMPNYIKRAQGGRIGKDNGGIMDLGGLEKDYRTTGGFVPLGGRERADDVPARLSKNEFVMTADAVRAAGGGSINRGAQRMYDTMKHLEANPQSRRMTA
jgi:hypothetical protein